MAMRYLAILAIAIGACGGDPDRTAYVLLDREARAAGMTLHAPGWEGAPERRYFVMGAIKTFFCRIDAISAILSSC